MDGYLAGIVDDFDGFSQRLRVAPGEHVIELYLDGHKTIAQTILFAPGQSYRIRHAMEPVTAGEAAPARPDAEARRRPAPPSFDAFGQPIGRAAASTKEAAAIAIRVQPGDASILVDGERWQTSGGERLEIQVTPGEHRIEIQKDGYQPFTTTHSRRPRRNRAGQRQPHQVWRRITMNRWMSTSDIRSAVPRRRCPPARSRNRPPPSTPGKLVVEEIQGGWLFAPDARATDLGGKTGALAGGYVGHITDRAWVIGAGALLPHQSRRRFQAGLRRAGVRMAGSGRSQDRLWRPRAGRRRIRDAAARDRRLHRSARRWHRAAAAVAIRAAAFGGFDPAATVAINDDFFVAEPQVNVMWNLSAGQRLVFGVGYREVGNAPLLGDQLNGISGSVAFQIGGK